METQIPRGTKDDELSPSKHQQHEQAAQVLNRSCPPPSTTKGIDDNLNGATSLNSHSHVSDSNQVKIPAINEEKCFWEELTEKLKNYNFLFNTRFLSVLGLCGSLFHSCLFCQSAAALGLPWKRWTLNSIVHTPASCVQLFTPLLQRLAQQLLFVVLSPLFCWSTLNIWSGLAWFPLIAGGGFSPFAFLCMFPFAPWQERSKLMSTMHFHIWHTLATILFWIYDTNECSLLGWVLKSLGTRWLEVMRKI